MSDIELPDGSPHVPSRVPPSRISLLHWCSSVIVHAGLMALLSWSVPRSGGLAGVGNAAGRGIDLTLIVSEAGSAQIETPDGTESTATPEGIPLSDAPVEEAQPADESVAERPTPESTDSLAEPPVEPAMLETEPPDAQPIEPPARTVATIDDLREDFAPKPVDDTPRAAEAATIERVSSAVDAVQPPRMKRLVEPAAILSGSGEEALDKQATRSGGRPRSAAAGFGVASNSAGTSFFGIAGTGTKFLYVVDCSGSMSHDNAFEAVRTELVASLQELDANKHFQIIFYNLKLFPMESRNRRQPYLPATGINRELARQFINSMQPDDGTSHFPALVKALSMKPEVIFFLTHVDTHVQVPELTARELKEIQRLNGGRTQIHAIQFGTGEFVDRENFLMRLARENKGTHTYHDVATLARAAAE